MSTTEPARGEAACLDTTFLEDLVPEEPAEREAFVEGFVADCVGSISDSLTTLRRECCSRREDGIRRAAHSLRGACLTLGATRLVELCRQLELPVPAADWSDRQRLVDAVHAAAENVIRALHAFRSDVASRAR